jgi:hypothetical protein
MLTAIRGNLRRPVGMSLQVALVFFIACAHAPTGTPAPAWVKDHAAEKGDRLYTVARGGPTGMPGDAREVALGRGARDLARSLGEIRVVVRSYDSLNDAGDQRNVDQSAVGEESETLFKAVLVDLRVDAEWIDMQGRYSGTGGRVYYLLLSIPKERP